MKYIKYRFLKDIHSVTWNYVLEQLRVLYPVLLVKSIQKISKLSNIEVPARIAF
jgi:hypothetical protein